MDPKVFCLVLIHSSLATWKKRLQIIAIEQDLLLHANRKYLCHTSCYSEWEFHSGNPEPTIWHPVPISTRIEFLDHHDHSSICLPAPPTLLKDCLLTPVVTCASTSDAALSPKSICDNVPVGTTATVVALAKTLVLLSLHFTHVNKQLTCTWSYELTFQNKSQSCERMKKSQVPAQGTSDPILYVTRSGINLRFPNEFKLSAVTTLTTKLTKSYVHNS